MAKTFHEIAARRRSWTRWKESDATMSMAFAWPEDGAMIEAKLPSHSAYQLASPTETRDIWHGIGVSVGSMHEQCWNTPSSHSAIKLTPNSSSFMSDVLVPEIRRTEYARPL